MKPINICIVVFNRYDLLARLIESIEGSILHPDREVNLYIIDRGHDHQRLYLALNGVHAELVDLPGQSLAAAWNWFIQNVPEERIIVSDDIEFAPESLETFVTTPGHLVGIDDGVSSAFACFLIRDSCVQRVGLFDETLSPDYLYFEDCDYKWRMTLAGLITSYVTGVHHGKSQSMAKKTPEQIADHHRRFVIARDNYIAKWGGLNDQETYVTPYGSNRILLERV